MISLATERLLATPLSPEHYPLLCELHRDPAVMATLGGVRPDDRTRAYLAENLAHWDEHGFGLWIFRERTTLAFVGRGGLRHLILDGQSEVELTYALAREAWGKGFATEIASATLDVAFRQLGLQDIVAFAIPENLASRRVMEKARFSYERDIEHQGERHVLYRLRAR